MTRYLMAEHLLAIARQATGSQPLVREPGILASAAERPATVLFGHEQYPNPLAKAGALMHSLARFHPLLDGNKRLAWLGLYTFLTVNGARVIASNDQAFDFTMAVSDGTLDEVAEIRKELAELVVFPE